MVLGMHLVLLVLAELVVCVDLFVVLDRHLVLFMCWLHVKWGAWSAPGARGEWPL